MSQIQEQASLAIEKVRQKREKSEAKLKAALDSLTERN